MRILILFLFTSFIFACKKNEGPFNSTGNYSGLLDSISIYFADSGNVNQQGLAYVFKFSYDNLKRIDKLRTDVDYFFYYNDASLNPYMIVDSSVSPSLPDHATVRKHLITYNNNGQKIKDTIVELYDRYFLTNTVQNRIPTIKVYKFNHQSNYNAMKVNSNTINDDTTYLDSQGDIPKYTWFTYGKQKNTISGYFADENPFNKLSIQAALLNKDIFFPTIFYPLSFDLCQPKHLFKTIQGVNETFFRYGPNEKTYINCNYSKNALGQIGVLVLSTSSYESGTNIFKGRFYTNLKFHFHP